MSAAQLALVFVAYSFLGWLIESVVLVWCERRFGNPGFLTGPVVPIYAVGALAILWLTEDLRPHPLLVFAVSAIVATVVEYLAHVMLQRLFGLVLWDYTGRFGNLRGRVCVGNSLAFGAAGLAVVYLLNPALTRAIAGLDPVFSVALASALLAVLAVDWTHSAVAVLRVRPELEAVRGSLGEARGRVEHEIEALGERFDLQWVRRRRRLLIRSARALARLEAACPGARAALRHALPARAEKVGVGVRR